MELILQEIEQLLRTFTEEWRKNKDAAEHAQIVDEWLRADQVMVILKISQRTLYNYNQKGAFVVKAIGRTTFYSRASVMSPDKR